MKQLPKKVIINNLPFNVVKDKTRAGSNLSYNDTLIRIGTKNASDREILESFIHEVAEIAMIERGMRTTRDKSQATSTALEYVFVGSHGQFNDVMTDVAGVLADMLKL